MADNATRHGLLSRREALKVSGGGALAIVAGASVFPRAASATPATAAKILSKLTGGRPTKEGRVKLKLPPIAENGNTVPMTVTVDSPMTDSDYVKTVHVVADANPGPHVASFHFTPMSGKAQVTTRIRMIKSQNVIAVAEMSDGTLYKTVRNVKVTIGGCGG